MTPEVGQLLTRIAASTAVIRSRSDEQARAFNHGDENLTQRVQALIAKLEKIADQLEEAIA
jgi:hypothetical protein